MPAYLVKKLPTSGQTRKDGANAAVVFANSAGDAKAMCKARFTGDSDASWDAATATELVAGADLEGYRLRVTLTGPTPVDVTVTGVAAATVDSIAALMVIALNLTAPIAAALYVGATNILTIAAIADALGDQTAAVEFLPPITMEGADKAPIPDFVGAIVDGGVSGADVTVQLGSDAVIVPNFVERINIE